MEASSLSSTAEDVTSVLLAEDRQVLDQPYVEDEEFPPGVPVSYDWMLQPASLRTSRRRIGLLVLTTAALLIAISFLLFYNSALSQNPS